MGKARPYFSNGLPSDFHLSAAAVGYNFSLLLFNLPINDEVYFAGSPANFVANTEHDYAKKEMQTKQKSKSHERRT